MDLPSIGGPELLDILRSDATLMANKSAKEGVEDMALLFTFLKAYQVLDKVSNIVLETDYPFMPPCFLARSPSTSHLPVV